MDDTFREHGSIERIDDHTHVVRTAGIDHQGKSRDHLLGLPGVTMENPFASEADRIYFKRFEKKPIYLGSESDRARRNTLAFGHPDVIVLGVTGYSRISPEDCSNWGITQDAYEYAVEDILANTILAVNREYPRVKIRICDGASDLGVDKAVISVARALAVPHLGTSCPNFMFYVNDDDDPVLVADSKEDYSDAFIANLDILISAGGGAQALKHDISAAIDLNKRLIPLDLIPMISPDGYGPPARDRSGNVRNATAAFLEAILVYQPRLSSGSSFGETRKWVQEAVIQETRKRISPRVAFSNWRNDPRLNLVRNGS